MKLKSAKIFCFPILVIFFGLGHFSEALNYSNSIDFYNESSELISKKGSGGKKAEVRKWDERKRVIIKHKLTWLKLKVIMKPWERKQKKDIKYGKRIKKLKNQI